MAGAVDDFAVFKHLLHRLPLPSSNPAPLALQLQRVTSLTHQCALLLQISQNEALQLAPCAFSALFLRCDACGASTARDLSSTSLLCAGCGKQHTLENVALTLQQTGVLTGAEKLRLLAAAARERCMKQDTKRSAVVLPAADVALEAEIVHDSAIGKFVVERMVRDYRGRPGIMELSGAARGDVLEFFNDDVAGGAGEEGKEQEKEGGFVSIKNRKRNIAAALAGNAEATPAVSFKRPMYQTIEPIADALEPAEKPETQRKRFNRITCSSSSRNLATAAAEANPSPQMMVCYRPPNKLTKKKELSWLERQQAVKVYTEYHQGELLLYAKCPNTRVLYNAIALPISPRLVQDLNAGDLDALMPTLVKRVTEAYADAANQPSCTINMLAAKVQKRLQTTVDNFLDQVQGERMQRIYGSAATNPPYMYAVKGKDVIGGVPSLSKLYQTLDSKSPVEDAAADFICFHDPRISTKFLVEHGKWFAQTIVRALPAVIQVVPPQLLSLRITADGKLHRKDGSLPTRTTNRDTALYAMLTMREGVASDIVNHGTAVTDLLPPMSSDDAMTIASELPARCAQCLSRLIDCSCVHDQPSRPLLAVRSRKRARMSFCDAYSAEHPARPRVEADELSSTLPINPYDLKSMRTYEQLLHRKNSRKSIADNPKGIEQYFAAPTSRYPDIEPWTTGPSQELLQYVNYMASQKIANAPELLGMFSETALLAVGVIVEELARDLVARPTVSKQQFLPLDGTAIQNELLSQLRGVDVHDPQFTPSIVQNRLAAMFGASVDQYEDQIVQACVEAKQYGDYIIPSSSSALESSFAAPGLHVSNTTSEDNPLTGVNADLDQASRGGFMLRSRHQPYSFSGAESFSETIERTADAFHLRNDGL